MREVQRLGEALHKAGDADLVDHLGELAGAGRAQQIAGACVGRDHLFGLREGLGVAAAHHREHAVLGAGLAAGDRRIDEVEAALFRFGVQFPRNRSRCRGVVDHDRAFAHACEHAVGTEHDFAQIVVIADAGHHEVLARGCRLRRRRAFAAVLRDPFFGFGRGAVVHRDLVAALGLEMPRHREAHHAKSDKCDLCHLNPPSAGHAGN